MVRLTAQRFAEFPSPRRGAAEAPVFGFLRLCRLLAAGCLAMAAARLGGGEAVAADEAPLVRGGAAVGEIYVDLRSSVGDGPATLRDAGQWLATAVAESTGARPSVRETPPPDGVAAVVIARREAWPELARAAQLHPDAYDAYCVVTRENRAYILGNSEAAARHGVADVLSRRGFRYYAPSPRWHIRPSADDFVVRENLADRPALIDRRIWYAYGHSGDDLAPLMLAYQRWATANRLSLRSLVQTGHSYGNMIGRNPEAFQQHPEFYALLPDGTRDATRAVNARKLCFSNPELQRLVAADRARLLEQMRAANPAAFMVSMDPSDGEGTCHCPNCQALGTTTDRVMHLANQVARDLREQSPRSWVGLYAYSSHRLPPTIDVEPNVYVQVAMGFNRTEYTLPELVDRWSKRVSAIGLREYYGVEAWDWGLPGRMRGAKVGYHREWIPYYAARKLNAINAETNANWGGQTPGLFVAAQLMWRPSTDVAPLLEEFYSECFGKAAPAMRRLYALFDEAPSLRASSLKPLFHELEKARQAESRADVQARINDVMAYLVFVVRFREFDLVRDREPERNDAYYDSLRQLMSYAWRIRHRDVVHYYALARRLCNGLPLSDKREEFYLARKEQPPVWQTGAPPNDEEVAELFAAALRTLEADDDPTVAYSRYLERVSAPGEDAGPSGILGDSRTAVARFRRRLTGYFLARGRQAVVFDVTPASRQVAIDVYLRGDEKLLERVLRRVAGADPQPPARIELELPRAGEYRIEFVGDFDLGMPPETPFVFEASARRPAWIDYSGPHYFYVPRNTKELVVDADPRLSLMAPGERKRRDVSPANRAPGRQHIVVPCPPESAGQIWRTTNMTRGVVSLLNVPPLLSFHRETLATPREVAEADQLTTGRKSN